jgi:gamma-glutamyltranspeptidase / glutathione hydrolase
MNRSSLRCPARVAAAAVAAFCLCATSSHASAQARPEVQGTGGAVVADHPLAAAAGADVLRRGGNAVDAAITMAAVLAVVRPHMNGVGGDAFLLIRDGRSARVQALNGSGRAGAAATPEAFVRAGHQRMPTSGVHSVTVPGAVRAWSDALRRHGTITLAEALAPAIRYAADGFPVSEKLAADIRSARRRLAEDPAMAEVFLPGGEPPAPGTLLRQPDLAATLETLARQGADAMYAGTLAAAIDAFMAAEGGFVRATDLARHSSTWQQPIATLYQGYRVLAFPPNTQGVALLMQMNMAGLFDLPAFGLNTAPYVHTLVEVKKLAFRERDRLVADPAFTDVPLDDMLSTVRARELVAEWSAGFTNGGTAGAGVGAGRDPDGDGDTVFLAAVDAEGNAVSMIQSLFSSFGSGRMVPGTGVVLHNRGGGFALDAGDLNVVAPGKRPRHTLAPAMVLHPEGALKMVLGTPGSDGQTQTQLQVFNNIVLFGMTAQAAVEAPRWRSWDDGRLQVERGVGEETLERLRGLGHDVRVQDGMVADLGGAQVILVLPSGVLAVGADPRREAYGIAW